MIPGLPGSMVSQGAADLMRRIEAIERWQREALPSVASSFGPVIADLQAQQADLAAKQLVLDAVVAQLVKPADFYDKQTGYAVANTYQTKASVTLTTPAGFTKALVTTAAHIRVLNTSAGVASYALIARINGVGGPMVAENVNAGLYGNTAVPFSDLVEGLTDGATFTVGTMLQCSPALTADAGNEATCNGTVLWFR